MALLDTRASNLSMLVKPLTCSLLIPLFIPLENASPLPKQGLRKFPTSSIQSLDLAEESERTVVWSRIDAPVIMYPAFFYRTNDQDIAPMDKRA